MAGQTVTRMDRHTERQTDGWTDSLKDGKIQAEANRNPYREEACVTERKCLSDTDESDTLTELS